MTKRVSGLIMVGLLLTTAWACETVPRQAYENLEEEHEELTEKNSQLQKKYYNLRAQNKTLRKRLKDHGESLEEFRKLASRVNTDASGAVKLSLPEGVKDEVKKTKVDGRTALRMSSQIVFEPGSATLSEEGKRTLQKLMPALSKFGSNVRYVVEGHTDNQPIQQSRDKFPTNWHLSAARAISVSQELISNGISKKQIRVVGRADTEPIASNDTEEGRRKNRRVEIIVVPRA